MVVFRPFVGEIIEARVKASSAKGLTLCMNFFDDIFIPAEKLPEPHRLETPENVSYAIVFPFPLFQIWYWEYDDGEGGIAKLYMDPGKVVRFRVVENVFKGTLNFF